MATVNAGGQETHPGTLPGKGNMEAESRSLCQRGTSMGGARCLHQASGSGKLRLLLACSASTSLHLHEEQVLRMAGRHEGKRKN